MFTGDAVDNFLEPNKIIKAKRQSGYVLATRGATKANFDAYGDAMLGAFEAGYGSGWTVAHQEAWGKCLGNLMDMYRLGVEDFQKEERDKKQAAIEEAKAAADKIKDAIKAAEKEAAEAQKAVEAAEKKRQEEDAKRAKEREDKAKKLASAEAKKSDEELMEERQAKEARMQMVRANQSARMKREAEALKDEQPFCICLKKGMVKGTPLY